MPVTCVWTLRRFDDFVCSLYLQGLSMGTAARPPGDLLFVRAEEVFGGMRQMEAHVDDVRYARYSPDGSHNAELLRALGVPSVLRETIEERVAGDLRLNPTITRKQAASLLNLESLSARCGRALDRRVLCRVFGSGTFTFEDDQPCVPVDEEVRGRLRQSALESAGDLGFEPYIRFFENEESEAPPSSEYLDLGSDLLSDEDLRRLLSAYSGLRATAGRVGEPSI
jgi:hypothetical protein